MTQDAQTQAWRDTGLPPRERAEALVAAMTLEQKISQLHGNMETIDIYAASDSAATAEEMEQLAAHQCAPARRGCLAGRRRAAVQRVRGGPAGGR